MTLPQHVQYWLLRQKKVLAIEVTPSLPGHRAWVGVYPPRLSRETFLVRYFEVDCELIDHDLDIHEEQLKNQETFTVADASELAIVLSRWIQDLNKLTGPSLCDYPV